MAGILRKILPVVQPSPKSGDDVENDAYNTEYSFAIEYSGPVSYNIPRVLPIVFDQIPVAAPVASSSLSSDISLPVVQPIVRHKRLKEPRLSSESFNGPCVSGESSTRVDSSDALGSPLRQLGQQIPVAAPVASSSLSSDSSLPLGQPIVRHKWSKEPKLSSESFIGPCVSGESSTRVDSSDALGSVTGDDGKLKSCDGISSNKQESSHCHDTSHDDVELPNNSHEGADAGFHDYMNPANSESTKSGLSSRSLSSEVFSCKEEYCESEETRGHVKRPSAVTFLQPDTSDMVNEESVYSVAESNDVRPKAERNGKKGSCYRCLKGNRFTVKEACIVCGAKYCSNCVVRAMGSMPEGRKCVPCIGFRIDEANRGNLGKSSWMLKRLLSDMEVKQIMRSEISCLVNQLPAEKVYVNGEPLSQKQLVILQGCPNPPKKLTPGSYWYDKVSGLWGKDGHKPCQIISPQLEVGGHLKADASNGNTNVFINSRQITKKELWVLQAAGEQCEGNPHFWLSEDGNYQEEGQNHVKGNMWDKKKSKLYCALFSLPTPTNSVRPLGDEVNYVELKRLHKLLLVGDKKSGTSTIYKQAKLQFKVPFSEDEHQNIKVIIQSNLYRYIAILLEGRGRFEEESSTEKGKQVVDPSSSSGQSDEKTVYSIGQRLKAFSDWLLKIMVSGNLEAIFPAATREYAPFVEELWKDVAFQATYNRRNELDMLPRVATYFLERAVEISRPIYEPSDMDILYAEGITSSNGLSSMEFSFPKSTQESFMDAVNASDQNDHLLRYQLIRVHPRSLGENCKWLEMFEDVDVVLFCVSLTAYDELVEDSNGNPTNKMLMSKQLFESIVTHPRFNEKDFLLLLNKYDLLEEKIEQVPLTKCEWFHDFKPVISHNHHNSSRRTSKTSLAQYAFHYIAVKFKILFQDLSGHKLFVSQVTGLEPESVEEALKYATEILKWEEEEHNYTHNELSSYTDFEQNSSS